MEDEEVVKPMSIRTGGSVRVLDPESAYDDVEEGLAAERLANSVDNSLNPRILPTRAYLDSAVSELLLKALYDLDRCRPDDPVEFFAYYLLKHNPLAQKTDSSS